MINRQDALDITDDVSKCVSGYISSAWLEERSKNELISRPVLERCGDCKYLGEESKENRGYYKCSIKGMDMRLHYFCGSWERREE